MVIMLLWACVPTMEDNSLEAADVSDIYMEELTEVSGTLGVAADEGEGDWTLTVGDGSWRVHSPSHADLGALDGLDVTLSATADWSGFPTLTLSDADGPRFVTTSTDDGTATFGRTVWKRGDVIGRGVVMDQQGSETHEQDARFTDVVVAADDGEVRLLPGEPASVSIDGVPWHFTVIAAYEADNPKGEKCGAPDVLAVELFRTDLAPGPTLLRPVDRFAPVGSCG